MDTRCYVNEIYLHILVLLNMMEIYISPFFFFNKFVSVLSISLSSGIPRNFFQGGCSTNSVEDRENGNLGGSSPLVRDSGGSCNLVQEVSFHMVKFS